MHTVQQGQQHHNGGKDPQGDTDLAIMLLPRMVCGGNIAPCQYHQQDKNNEGEKKPYHPDSITFSPMSSPDDKHKDGDSDFAREMRAQGVAPLKNHSSILPPRRQHHPRSRPKTLPPHLLHRRQQAQGEDSPLPGASAHLGDHLNRWLGPHEVVEFQRPGLQHGQFRDLRQGKIQVGASLDLHRCTVEQSRSMLLTFVKECRCRGIRCALVMHGKGLHSRHENPAGKAQARIKSFCVHWLQQMPEVLALSSAQPRDGGSGALYVLFTSLDGAGKLPPSL